MTRDEFWRLIEAARAADPALPEEGLHEVLEPLGAAELGSFQAHFDELFDAAYRWSLWGAAYLIEGGCSDDGFIDFRYGLVSLGRRAYEGALADPDSLVSVEDAIPNESFGYVASQLFEAKAGRPMAERRSNAPDAPAGDEWDFDDEGENARRFPRLFARFGGGG